MANNGQILVPKDNPVIEAGLELRYVIGLGNRFLSSEASLQKHWECNKRSEKECTLHARTERK
jgi:hypothetical protein